MLVCIFATNCNSTASDRPLRRTIQGHRKERQSHQNPYDWQGRNGLC